MEWQIIVALVVVIPVILFPVLFVMYLNTGGIFKAFQVARSRKAVQARKTEEIDVVRIKVK